LEGNSGTGVVPDEISGEDDVMAPDGLLSVVASEVGSEGPETGTLA
jgi:hypothetical protein